MTTDTPNLSTDKKRRLIAEACGWKWVNEPILGWKLCQPYRWKSYKADWLAANCSPTAEEKERGDVAPGLPYYFDDLNAMHEAEKTLTHEQAERYAQLLCNEPGELVVEMSILDLAGCVMLPAAQRAEAFGRCLSLW